jgi:hypothetical protein
MSTILRGFTLGFVLACILAGTTARAGYDCKEALEKPTPVADAEQMALLYRCEAEHDFGHGPLVLCVFLARPSHEVYYQVADLTFHNWPVNTIGRFPTTQVTRYYNALTASRTERHSDASHTSRVVQKLEVYRPVFGEGMRAKLHGENYLRYTGRWAPEVDESFTYRFSCERHYY